MITLIIIFKEDFVKLCRRIFYSKDLNLPYFFVLNNKTILIGISERTSKEAINILIPHLFNEGFEYVAAINLPKKRAMMHLDTIFTQISINEFILYNRFYCAVSGSPIDPGRENRFDLIKIKDYE